MSDLPPLREALKAQGILARKSLGQHFLLDENITRRIAALAGDLTGTPVIEVGPGPGGLTRALLDAGADPLIAIETDARFIDFLQPLVAWSGGRLRLVHADALKIDEAALLGGRRAAIISNLPYNVGTPLLVKWLKARSWRGTMLLMFQKEVAERIIAAPGDGAYGRLAVLAQAVCHVEIVLKAPAGAFTPAPKVDSAVVFFRDLEKPYAHLDALERVTAAAFGQRRKMLRAALKTLTRDPERLLGLAEIAPTARAEEIGVARFIHLAECWRRETA